MYSPGSPKEINVTLYRETDKGVGMVTLSRRLFSAQNGYLAGEAPEGLTTNESIPVSAKIRVVSREPEGFIGDGYIMSVTTSNEDGTWFAGGLSPARTYDVVGRLDGHQDVIVSSLRPVPIDRIYTEGEIVYNESTLRFEGFLTVIGAFPPYSMSVITPPPDGCTVNLSGREITISGAALEAPESSPLVVIQIDSSNEVMRGIVIGTGGMVPPLNFTGAVKVVFRPTRLAATRHYSGKIRLLAPEAAKRAANQGRAGHRPRPCASQPR